MSRPGLTVIVPALNEERGLGPTLEALKSAVLRLAGPVEIIVVDDGSTDGTGRIAAASGARVIRHETPRGYGRALKSGIEAASHELIAITDADGTYPIEELPALVALAEGKELVVGARTGPHYRRRWLLSPLRSGFLSLSSWAAGRDVPDPNSGLRVFRRRSVGALFPLLPEGFSFTTTMTLVFLLTRRAVVFHPIAYHRRVGRSKVRIVRDALRAFRKILELVLRYEPRRLFNGIASLFATVGFGFVLGSFFEPQIFIGAAACGTAALVNYTAGARYGARAR